MARFPFSMSGRRKQQPAPQLTVTEPMSKAHRILGSTPLSIDAPPSWDDACSSASDDRSGTTATSYPDSEARDLYDYHPVGIAKSENGWGDDSDVLPHPLRHSAVDIGDESEAGRTTVSSLLRKSHSSSTIKSWYDKTKLPLSISQQTSSSAMARGPPSGKAARLLDVDDIYSSSRTRRKPAKLDHSSIVPGSRASRKSSQPGKHQVDDLRQGPDYRMKSSSKLSPNSLSPSTPSARQVQRRRTSESLHPHAAESSRPGTSGTSCGNPWPPKNAALGELPSLYDHYEQMSLRQVMRQDAKPDISLAVREKSRLSAAQSPGPRGSKALDWIHTDPMPTTPRSALFTKPLEPSSPANYATSVSSRHTKTSRASRTTDRSFGTTDLQQTSVLMLSSDSEDDVADGIVPPIATTKSPVSARVRRPSNSEDDIPQLDSSRPNTSKESTRSERRLSRSSKSSKRASFAPSNTYITIPGASERTKTPVVDSRSNTPFGNMSQTTNGSSSRRASFMSNYSGNSAMTWQTKSGCSIQEARAITMLTARRPSDLEMEEQEEAQLSQGMEFDHSVFNREPASSSADQLTPPLSPTSVDFYIRSGRSSIDGPGSHNRLMAVTRQEEMLLAALRQKQTSIRGNVIAELEEGNEEDEEEHQGMKRESRSLRQSRGNRSSKESQATITDSNFDFGFPAPPSFKNDSNSSAVEGRSPRNRSSSRQSSGSRRPSSVVLVNSDAQSICSDYSLAPPKSILRKSSYDSTAEQVQEEVAVYLDIDPSPDLTDFQDWEDALSMPSDFDSMVRPTLQKDHTGRRRSSVRSSSGSHTTLQPDTFSRSNGGRLAGVVEETSADIEEEEEDIPRPDSPISPDSFPAVPEKRMTLSKMARLSAVGPGLLGGLSGTEPGWWGDDD